jgi:hypothetical protein
VSPPRKAPVVVDAGVAVVFDAGPAAREPDNVLALPDDPVGPEDITDEKRLRALLLRDPRQAERQLVALAAPNQWQVALLAQLALRRGQRAPGALSEDSLAALPQPPIVTGAGRAWVSVSEAVLWGAGRQTLAQPASPAAAWHAGRSVGARWWNRHGGRRAGHDG